MDIALLPAFVMEKLAHSVNLLNLKQGKKSIKQNTILNLFLQTTVSHVTNAYLYHKTRANVVSILSNDTAICQSKQTTMTNNVKQSRRLVNRICH